MSEQNSWFQNLAQIAPRKWFNKIIKTEDKAKNKISAT